jgi:RNA polymerase sigma factor (sigma-70 family)
LEESELIAGLVKSDEDSFKFLVDLYKNKVYNTCIGLVQNKNDAEDLTQEVFVEIFLSINQFKRKSKLSTWIYRIAVMKSLDLLRRRKRKKRFAFITSLFGEKGEIIHDSVNFFHPGVIAENKELSSILFSTVSKLPASQNIAFILNKVEGLSYNEISEVMNISVSAVESVLFRAKKNLQKKLQKYYDELK